MSDVTFRERTYLSADGETTVHAYVWAPEAPRAVVQLSHGMCEYVTRYRAWAERFAAAGFVFCGNDHLGHGNTAGGEENLGFTARRGGDALLVEDLHTLTAQMRAEYPDLPIFLYGHSMGSFAARAYLARYGSELAGALISGTGGPDNPTGLAKWLVHAGAALRGDRYRSKFIQKLAFGAYNKRFKEENDPLSWLTRDKSVRDAYRADPWCTFPFTAAGYDTLFSLLGGVSRRDWAEKVPKTLPVLLFSGEEDPVGNYGKGVRAVYERLKAAGVNATLKLYAGGRHEMHNEINRDEVFADLLAFLEGVLHGA